MKKLDFTIGLIFLIVLTVIVYNVFGFEITLIYLIIDMSVGISYQFAKLNKFIEEEQKSRAAIETSTKDYQKIMEEVKSNE